MFVHWYNAGHTDSVLLFPFIDSLVPSIRGDHGAMGAASVKLLAGLGVISLVLQARSVLFRERSQGSD